jgi:hypothetical protein
MQTSASIKESVFEKRPILKKVLEQYGNLSVFDYVSENIDGAVSRAANILPERKKELLEVFEQEAAKVLGVGIARGAAADLSKNYFVCTADHHGPICHPFFINSNLLLGAVLEEKGFKHVNILPCANVSLNNSSFPRGLFYHSPHEHIEHEADTSGFKSSNIVRIPLLPNSVQGTVLSHGPYSADFIKKKMSKTLAGIYMQPEVLAMKNYADQITRTNYDLFHLVSPENLVYLPQENLAAKLLLRHLERASIINKILFDHGAQALIKKHFNGIDGAFDLNRKHGTFLFWGSGQPREQIWDLNLAPEQLKKMLLSGELVPSMLLTFIVLSFYYGLTCFGGFSQINYLTDMKQAYQNFCAELGLDEKVDVQTDGFCGEIVLNYLNGAPATILDLIRHGGIKHWPEISAKAKQTTLNQAIEPMFAEFYEIIF